MYTDTQRQASYKAVMFPEGKKLMYTKKYKLYERKLNDVKTWIFIFSNIPDSLAEKNSSIKAQQFERANLTPGKSSFLLIATIDS